MQLSKTEPPPRVRGWRELLGPAYLGPMVVLAGGVALYAINIYLTTSLLPSAIDEIGGARLYAWATTIFLVASVVAAVLVSRLLAAAGPRGAYLAAVAVFAVGTVVCAAAPDMAILLLGRALQGFGGGLLSGLGYALIRSVLPPHLWARASALVSGMWGLGTFVGPSLGGLFAQFGAWRLAFVVLAVLAAGIGAMVPRYISGRRPDEATPDVVPVRSMLLLSSAALVVSVASLATHAGVAAAGVLAGLALLVAFVVCERGSTVRVLPATTFTARNHLKWAYLTIALLAVASTAETFVPLFGQRLGGLAPVAAGFLGAALAVGWTIGELSSAGVARPRVVRAVVVAGPALVALGLFAASLGQRETSSGWVIATWVAALVVAGAGIGVAWPHLATFVMGSVDDPGEGGRAAAAINTVQLVANAFGSALAGVLVNLGGSMAGSAQLLFGLFAVVAVVAVPMAWRSAPVR
ncbi:MFS transporter [Rhodococcus spelaei]|uniref:MFS transporter n=1 Tax=Rhodococcus spelaei TaxID=2546320 RepID=A0A541BRX3_9NOCA|nr:MFS transporter [Rhodococcus spelaei]TQF75084.1 MFS transporter [Rhodococcus spelaei]